MLFFERKPGSRDAVDQGPLDLRPAHQPALHPQDKPARPEPTSTTSSTATGPERSRKREETERFKRFTYDEIVARDKANLDIFWLTDESLEDTDNLPAPGVIAAEIVEDLEAALEEFRALAESLAEVGVEVDEAD